MRTEECEVRMPGPPLPVILRELVDRICSDDWHRLSTEEGSKFYYIVGEEAAQAHRDNLLSFKVSEFPSRKSAATPQEPRPLAGWVVRSQLAGEHPDYLQDARRRLEKAGVASTKIWLIVAPGSTPSRLRTHNLRKPRIAISTVSTEQVLFLVPQRWKGT